MNEKIKNVHIPQYKLEKTNINYQGLFTNIKHFKHKTNCKLTRNQNQKAKTKKLSRSQNQKFRRCFLISSAAD